MNESWTERLNRYEAPLPEGAWERLSDRLDQQETSALQHRMQAYETIPPSRLWERIEEALDAAPSAPVLAVPARRRSFFLYAAAAAVVGAVLVGSAVLLLRHRPAEDTVATNTVARPAPALPAPEATEKQPETTGDLAAGAVIPEATEQTPEDPSGHRPAAARRAGTAAQVALARHNHVDDERYLVRAYNNGNTVRFSKKVSEVMDCAEHSTGFSQSLCQVSIGMVQDKLATNATSVSTDFGGLIEQLRDLEKTSSR